MCLFVAKLKPALPEEINMDKQDEQDFGF